MHHDHHNQVKEQFHHPKEFSLASLLLILPSLSRHWQQPVYSSLMVFAFERMSYTQNCIEVNLMSLVCLTYEPV